VATTKRREIADLDVPVEERSTAPPTGSRAALRAASRPYARSAAGRAAWGPVPAAGSSGRTSPPPHAHEP